MKAQEETAFSFQKKRVSVDNFDHVSRCMLGCTTVSLSVVGTTQGINVEKKEARAEKEEAERFQRLTRELVSSWLSSWALVMVSPPLLLQ